MATPYYVPGTTVTWKDSGGTYTMALKNLADSAGRKGPKHNFGSTIPIGGVLIMLVADMASAPTAGNVLELYMACSVDDSVYEGGVLGVPGDGAWYDEQIKLQLTFIGAIPLDNSTDQQAKSFVWQPRCQYCFPVLINKSGQLTTNTDNLTYITMTPINPVS